MSNDFIEVPEIFQVNVYDYLSGKNYVYKKDFDSYSAAEDFIKHYDFESDFLKNPIGISILSMPKVTLSNLVISGVSNG